MRDVFRPWSIVACLIALLPVALSAHLTLARSSPADGATVLSPKQLQLWFSEEPLLPLTSVTLTGPKGSVALDPPRASAERSVTIGIGASLAPGRYRIGWKSAGDDGHVVVGTVDFTVKESTRPPM
jgi:methionine-rich copper-binding protein CopC